MNLFFRSAKKSKPTITPEDRRWVEECFQWLIEGFGYPEKTRAQINISADFFPGTFSSNEIKLEKLITDLCHLFSLDAGKIRFEVHTDIRDGHGIPYQAGQANSPDTDFDSTESGYLIHIANDLTRTPKRLIFSLLYDFIRIRLTESKTDYGSSGHENLFIYLAGIYFGFGVILTENLTEIGRSSDGMWEKRWNYASAMPREVMLFGLALQCKLANQEQEPWVTNLPKALKADFQKALDFLEAAPSALVDKNEIEANALYDQACTLYSEGKYEASVPVYDKIPGLTNNIFLQSDAFNGAGYSLLRMGEYQKSIPYFRKALVAYPDYGYAHDNLGYALVKTGKLEEGKESLAQALQTDNNDNAYSYRNLALYHWAKGEPAEAEKNFQLAFDTESQPVDLLEFHYAEFLLSQGKQQEGLRFLKTAVEKGEHEAISKLKELNQ